MKTLRFSLHFEKAYFDRMSVHIYKSNNKTLLLYHIVLPLKYRRKVITEEIGITLKMICLEMSERYEMEFIEIGHEPDHVHFLVQNVPKLSVSKLITSLKSITAKELFRLHSEIKRELWGGSFWTSSYYANTVGQYSNEEVIRKYVENQCMTKSYKKLHSQQLRLF